MHNSLPWREIFYLAFYCLKLLPKDFWNLTPKELMLMIQSYPPANHNNSTISKEELQQLIAKSRSSNREFNYENQK